MALCCHKTRSHFSFVDIYNCLHYLSCVVMSSLRSVPFSDGRYLYLEHAHMILHRRANCNEHETVSSSVSSPKSRKTLIRRTPDHEGNILEAVGEDPAISTRQVTLVCRTSHSTWWRVLQDHLMYSYILQCVQGYSPSDHSPLLMMVYCTNSWVDVCILFTDEAIFYKRSNNKFTQPDFVDESEFPLSYTG